MPLVMGKLGFVSCAFSAGTQIQPSSTSCIRLCSCAKATWMGLETCTLIPWLGQNKLIVISYFYRAENLYMNTKLKKRKDFSNALLQPDGVLSLVG